MPTILVRRHWSRRGACTCFLASVIQGWEQLEASGESGALWGRKRRLQQSAIQIDNDKRAAVGSNDAAKLLRRCTKMESEVMQHRLKPVPPLNSSVAQASACAVC